MDNQENTKLIYSVLQDIFKNIWEQQKYSEVKNGIILTLNIAILTILTRIPINEDFICKVTFFILIVLFFIHIFLILQSFFPKNKNKEKRYAGVFYIHGTYYDKRAGKGLFQLEGTGR